MRTNIDIDDKLMKQAMTATGTSTKKAAVEASMRLAVRDNERQGLKDLFGKVVWRGHDDDWFASDEEILRLRRLARSRGTPSKRPLKNGVTGSAQDGQR